jgi:hypothetical protein
MMPDDPTQAHPDTFDSDFYEEDEPVEGILAIFAQGPVGVTAPPEEGDPDDRQ